MGDHVSSVGAQSQSMYRRNQSRPNEDFDLGQEQQIVSKRGKSETHGPAAILEISREAIAAARSRQSQKSPSND